jgi:hypothetical protein
VVTLDWGIYRSLGTYAFWNDRSEQKVNADLFLGIASMAGDDPITDQPNAPPGHWAAKAIKTLWPSGRKGSFLYGPILPKLQNLDAVREPSLRPSREWKAEKVDFNIDLKREMSKPFLFRPLGRR